MPWLPHRLYCLHGTDLEDYSEDAAGPEYNDFNNYGYTLFYLDNTTILRAAKVIGF